MTDSSPASDLSNIDLSKVPAIVTWVGADGQPLEIHQIDQDPSRLVTFDIHVNAVSKCAFFKLRAWAELKALPNKKTPLYLHVHPDQICSLVCDGPSQVPADTRKKLGDATICLRFHLSRPADLVVPHVSLVPRRQKGNGDTIDALKLLAKATSLNVYLTHHTLSEALLRPLCDAVVQRSLKAPGWAPGLAGLYSGRGGKIQSIGASPPPPPTSPPSYDELAPSPPPPAFEKATRSDAGSATRFATGIASEIGAAQGGYSKKRRRDSTPNTSDVKDSESVESTCRRLVENMMAQYRQEERAYLDKELQKLKTEIMEQVDNRMSEIAEDLANTYRKDEVDEQIDQAEQRSDDLIDVRIEDRVTGIKVELEEFVEDQVGGAEDRVLQRLRTANLILDIGTG